MPRVTIVRLLLATASLAILLVACSAKPSVILDTDIPAPPGLESVFARGLERRGDELIAGRFVFHGRVNDARSLLERTLAQFRARGWTLTSRRTGDASCLAVVVKGDRQATISIVANQIDPPMSKAQIDVSLVGPRPADAPPPGETVAPAPSGVAPEAPPAASPSAPPAEPATPPEAPASAPTPNPAT